MTNDTPTSSPGPVLLDAHVHFHACFDRDRFLDAAAVNFRAAARVLGLPVPRTGVLLMTESAGAEAFRSFRELAKEGSAAPGAWSFARTAEEDSLVVRRGGDPDFALVVVAGRQIVTAEALEVLALGRDATYQDGRPIREALDDVRRKDALPVVPWGFGKWWFGRGRLVAGLLAQAGSQDLFLGDNGGRPAWGSRPRLLREAERRGIRVLPGSDPLPLPAHVDRAGSFGLTLEPGLDPERPAESARRLLRASRTRLTPYGPCQSLVPFLANQVRMQWRKRSNGAVR